MASTSLALLSPPLNPNSLIPPLSLPKHRSLHFPNPNPNPNPRFRFLLPLLKRPKFTKFSAIADDSLPTEAISVEDSQQIVASTGQDGVSTVVSVLLFAAFVGLSILTVGVIYLWVTDFLQKREKDKFEKEEASTNKKKSKKKVKVRARAGPRGFGQKLDLDDGDDV